MLPLLSFHAIASRRGDGLHPVLLSALKRIANERAGDVVGHSGYAPEGAIEPANDRVMGQKGTKPLQAV
jgi:hypothetical protein